MRVTICPRRSSASIVRSFEPRGRNASASTRPRARHPAGGGRPRRSRRSPSPAPRARSRRTGSTVTVNQPPASSVSASARAASGINPRPRASGTRNPSRPPRRGSTSASHHDCRITDGLAVRLDHPRVDLGAGQPLSHLAWRERLAVPVARDLGIGMPAAQQFDVAFCGRPHEGQPSRSEPLIPSAYEATRSLGPRVRKMVPGTVSTVPGTGQS